MSIYDRLYMSIIYRHKCDKRMAEGRNNMEEYSLGNIESRFADIIWEHAPLSTSELIKLCEEALGWKRTTTYTVLKKLSERGIFQNQNGTVLVLISKEEFYARQSESYIERSFGGSLPSFLAAFTSRKALSKEEIQEIQDIINQKK